MEGVIIIRIRILLLFSLFCASISSGSPTGSDILGVFLFHVEKKGPCRSAVDMQATQVREMNCNRGKERLGMGTRESTFGGLSMVC